MKKIAPAILIGTFTLLALPAFPKNDGRHEIEQLVDVTRELPRPIRAAMIAQKYRFLYPSTNLDSYDTPALRARFQAADVATFYSHDSAIAIEMLEIYGILRTRGANDSEDLSAVAGAQVISRNFDAIREILKTEPLPKELHVPEIEGIASDASVDWQVLIPDGEKLILDRRSMEDGKAVIVVSHPLCGFSAAATEAIESDRHLSGFFAKHGLWLVPPTRQLYLDEIVSWNRNHPSQEMVLAYQANNWPIIDDWSTPIFYLVQDGDLVDKISGWPKDGQNLEKLRAAVDRFVRP